MAYKKLTETGKNFIKHIASVASNDALLEGNNGLLPFSTETDEGKVWKCNIIDIRNNNSITNNSDFAEYLIYLYKKYGIESEIDVNIMAAQAYRDSRYRCWIYDNKIGATSSLYKLPMNIVYDILYVKGWVTDEELDTIVDGMTNPSSSTSWRKVDQQEFLNEKNNEAQRVNRSILHQNMVDNPHIIVKIQCSLMAYIAERNNNLASSSLFTYKTDYQQTSKNYIEAINMISRIFTNNYSDKGILYAEEVFGYLGDKDNQYITTLNDETKGYWFAYKLKLDKKEWNEYDADSISNFVPEKSTASISAMDSELRRGYEGAKVTWFERYGDTYIINLTSVFRTKDHQHNLFLDGQTPVSGRGTDLSLHNYFKTKAFDFGVYTSSNQYLDGRKHREFRHFYEEFFDYVHDILPNAVWGGTFGNAKNDVVHIQI